MCWLLKKYIFPSEGKTKIEMNVIPFSVSCFPILIKFRLYENISHKTADSYCFIYSEHILRDKLYFHAKKNWISSLFLNSRLFFFIWFIFIWKRTKYKIISSKFHFLFVLALFAQHFCIVILFIVFYLCIFVFLSFFSVYLHICLFLWKIFFIQSAQHWGAFQIFCKPTCCLPNNPLHNLYSYLYMRIVDVNSEEKK